MDAFTDDIEQVLITEADIQAKLAEMGAKITADYRDRSLLLVGVLKGAFVVMADLARHIELPLQFDFMAVSSYGAATKTSGVVRILKDLDHDLRDRDVLVVEDIVDSGLTLKYLLKNLAGRKPASLEVARAPAQGGDPAGPPRRAVRGLRHPERVRRRLWPRLRGEVPEPAVHRQAPALCVCVLRRNPGVAGRVQRRCGRSSPS